MADLGPYPGYHRDQLIPGTRRDSTAPCRNILDFPTSPLPHMNTYTATPSPHETDLISYSLANARQRVLTSGPNAHTIPRLVTPPLTRKGHLDRAERAPKGSTPQNANTAPSADPTSPNPVDRATSTNKPHTGILAPNAPRASTPPCSKHFGFHLHRYTFSRLRGGHPLNILATMRPHTRKYRDASALHKNEIDFAPFAVVTRNNDLPPIHNIHN